jgi:hypothetical protein
MAFSFGAAGAMCLGTYILRRGSIESPVDCMKVRSSLCTEIRAFDRTFIERPRHVWSFAAPLIA